MPLFDAYLMVDWSANSKPKTGKDSIWWCLVERQDNQCDIRSTSNPATREQATREIRQVLMEAVGSGQRILVGFDFAYGYPKGFAHHLGLAAQESWLGVWRELSSRIEDTDDNRNNRFNVAAALNKQISGVDAPFWGCPETRMSQHLSTRKPDWYKSSELQEFRMSESRVGAHSTWKLFYTGSVGSQVLLGLPRVYQLRTDPELEQVSCVWPFETGLKPLLKDILAEKRIVHAEIYPSLIKVRTGPGEVKDQLQVQTLALHFALLDKDGCLGELFAGDTQLSDEERHVVECEEGWILGVC